MNGDNTPSDQRPQHQRRRIARISVLIVSIVLTYFLLHSITPIIYNPQLLAFVQKSELIEFVIFPVLYLATTIIVVIPDFPLNLIGVNLFGATTTVVVIYFLSIIASYIEFLLVKKFGRRVLQFVIHEKGLEQVVSYVNRLNYADFFIARLLGIYFFDPISYIAAISEIPISKYLLITAAGSLPYFFIFWLAAIKFTEIGQLYIANEIIRYTLLLLFLVYWFKFRKQH